MKHFKAKVDVNHSTIVDFYRGIGAVVDSVAMIKDFCDIIVSAGGKTYYVEIKNPEYLPKKFFNSMSYAEQVDYMVKNKLTEGEFKCYEKLKKVNVTYWIVWDDDSAMKIFE